MSEAPHRFGHVALVGRPNVGKSTLLNAIVGAPLSIVTPKPQTTRHRILGIATRPDAQIVFVDTPGIHKPRSTLGERLNASAEEALGGVDVVCLVLDGARVARRHVREERLERAQRLRAVAEARLGEPEPAIGVGLVGDELDHARQRHARGLEVLALERVDAGVEEPLRLLRRVGGRRARGVGAGVGDRAGGEHGDEQGERARHGVGSSEVPWLMSGTVAPISSTVTVGPESAELPQRR